jgi:hypothetical protein
VRPERIVFQPPLLDQRLGVGVESGSNRMKKEVPLPYLHRHEDATHAAPKPDRGTGEEISRRSDSSLLSEITKAMIHTSRFSPVISLLVMVPVFVYSLLGRSYSDENKL